MLKDVDVGSLPMGFLAAGTGAAAAFVEAARHPHAVKAIVTRRGRVDLAERYLKQVRAPTMLIVGEHDKNILDLNRESLKLFRCEKQLKIVPGATHLFPDSGGIEAVSKLAGEWFHRHLHAVRLGRLNSPELKLT